MTLSESAIYEIAAALDNGNGADLVRQLAELGMQGLIEAEATEHVGAERWERTIDLGRVARITQETWTGWCPPRHLRRPRGSEDSNPQMLPRSVMAAMSSSLHPHLLATVPKGQSEVVAAAFRSIFALGTVAEVLARRDEVADTLEAKHPKAAVSMRAAKTDVVAFTAFPRAHWRKIWSNNPLERLNKEVKCRSNVVGIFPNDKAAIRLIDAVLADQHEEWVIARRYMPEGSMAELDQPRDTQDPQAELDA